MVMFVSLCDMDVLAVWYYPGFYSMVIASQGQSEEGAWLIQLLREQCELLEIILLYYKDYDHVTSDLFVTAKRFQVC